MSTIKKMLLVVTACVFVLALAACGDKKNNTTTTTTPTPTTVAAATATPTPVPDRDLKGLAVVVGDWWSGDDWQFPTSSTADELNSEYQHEMMKKYNYTEAEAIIPIIIAVLIFQLFTTKYALAST